MTSNKPGHLSLLTAVAAAVLCAGVLSTAAANQTGFTGPSTVPMATVKELVDAGRDDQKAVLRGRLVSSNGGDKYTFEDGTGQITVEIDRHLFQGTVDPKTGVELIGELERDSRKLEFDVDQLRLR